MSNTKLQKEVRLRSVGCVLDTEIAIVYPMWKDGTADVDNPHTLEDMPNEWLDDLSDSDHDIVQYIKQQYKSASPKQCVELRRLLEESYDLIDSLEKRLPDLYTKGSTTDVLHRECKLLINRIAKVKFFLIHNLNE